jgi:hypothetical protein
MPGPLLKCRWKLIRKEGEYFVYQCVWCLRTKKVKKKGQ